MKRCLPFFLLIFLFHAAGLRAESGCPWLTQGTVATLLGGEVTANIHAANADAGSCRFSLHHGAMEYELEVTVASAAGATCPAGSPKVTGVGSEAFSCAAKRASWETTDMISGRVRTTYFVIRLTGKGASNPLAPEKRSEIVERAAEAVSGNLF